MKTEKLKTPLGRVFSADHRTKERQCNRCRQLFRPEFKLQLLCRKCRAKDDCAMFGEWHAVFGELPRNRTPEFRRVLEAPWRLYEQHVHSTLLQKTACGDKVITLEVVRVWR